MIMAPDMARETFRKAASHLVPGVAERNRAMGMGAVEASGSGAEVTLSDGRTVLDFGNYAVTLFGHRPARVIEAVRDALDLMPTTTKILASPYPAALAARLVNLLDPGRLTRVWFGLNGADAVEVALKLAIAQTGRPAILAVENGFHGKSMGALAATADPERRKAISAFLGDARHIPLDADAVARAVHEAPFAALIVEPVQGEGGGRPLPPDLLRRWRADARAAGAFFISDEIQCGLRRCGAPSLAVDYGLAPDAVLLGKPLGGGVMPLSAAICTPELFDPLLDDPFFHSATFSGHPLSCAAGLAALDLLAELADHFGVVAAALATGIAEVAQQHPEVVAVGRTTGLLGALQFTTQKRAGLAMLEAGRRGLLLSQCVTDTSVARVMPPVVATEEQMATAIAVLHATCRSVARRTSRLPTPGASATRDLSRQSPS
jgi:putrescine aminotransferase